jgi:hypothetical protein
MITYLDFAENALARSKTAAEFRQSILDRFPKHGCGESSAMNCGFYSIESPGGSICLAGLFSPPLWF